MTVLRMGTRGSDLALIQTRMVRAMIQAVDPRLQFEEVVIRTHGDQASHQLFDIHWPAGGFTGAIEQALLRGEIDLGVHSHKDLPTEQTPGLTIAAVPPRHAAHDVLVCDGKVDISALPAGFRIGTSSPRRAAQLRWFCGPVVVLPLRGNVPTRLARLRDGELDAVVLAAAGLDRLKIAPEYRFDLPLDRFVPSPAQGALAVQVRQSSQFEGLIAAIDHPNSRRAVEAERAFLSCIGAGCHTPAAAFATVEGEHVRLTGQWFSDDALRMALGSECGSIGTEIAASLAARLRRELG